MTRRPRLEPPRLERYILVGRRPAPCPDLMEWAHFMENGDGRLVNWTGNDTLFVSTIFLGLDHNFFGDGPPILFETMIFRDGIGDECLRSSTWEAAEEAHERMVAEVLPILAKARG